MLTKIRKLGNSKGIIIPAAFLASCGIEQEVEMHMEGKAIILEPPKTLRQGWFKSYKVEEDPAEEVAQDWDCVAEDGGVWEW